MSLYICYFFFFFFFNDTATTEIYTLSLHDALPILNNAFAAVNMAAGHPEAAIKYLEAALRSRPDYFDAHYNLGTALAMREDFEGAVEHFRAAVRLHPEDANAEAKLGGALAETGHWKEARAHLERALTIDPNNTLARENLEQVKRGAPRDNE